MIISIAFGVSDEVHQSFVPGRTASFKDVMADAAGAGLAVAVALGFGYRQGPAERQIEITVFGRSGCHLCEEAEAVIEERYYQAMKALPRSSSNLGSSNITGTTAARMVVIVLGRFQKRSASAGPAGDPAGRRAWRDSGGVGLLRGRGRLLGPAAEVQDVGLEAPGRLTAGALPQRSVAQGERLVVLALHQVHVAEHQVGEAGDVAALE